MNMPRTYEQCVLHLPQVWIPAHFFLLAATASARTTATAGAAARAEVVGSKHSARSLLGPGGRWCQNGVQGVEPPEHALGGHRDQDRNAT